MGLWSLYFHVSKIQIFVFKRFTFIFSDYKGILKAGIIGGILLRESVSISKIPMPKDDKDTFQVPIGIPVSMPSETEMTDKRGKQKRKQVGHEEEKELDKDADRLSSDEDTKRLNEDADDLLAEINTDGPDPYE